MLILETGAGLADANSYADVAEADAYFADREIAAWSAATAQNRSAALIRATDYIDANYIFRSVKAVDEQSLENPRYPLDTLSPYLVKATIELALQLLSIDPFAAVTQRDIVSETTTIEGALTDSKDYSQERVNDAFPMITKILRNIATRRGASASSGRLTL